MVMSWSALYRGGVKWWGALLVLRSVDEVNLYFSTYWSKNILATSMVFQCSMEFCGLPSHSMTCHIRKIIINNYPSGTFYHVLHNSILFHSIP